MDREPPRSQRLRSSRTGAISVPTPDGLAAAVPSAQADVFCGREFIRRFGRVNWSTIYLTLTLS